MYELRIETIDAQIKGENTRHKERVRELKKERAGFIKKEKRLAALKTKEAELLQEAEAPTEGAE